MCAGDGWRRWAALVVVVGVLAGCTADEVPVDPDATAAPAAPTPNADAPPAVADPGPPPTPTATEAPPTTSAPAPTPGELVVAASFDPSLAPEVSGIAVSRRDPGLFWLVDDAGGTSSVVGVHADGRPPVRVELEGVAGVNLEDLAAAPCGPGDPTTCLYVADIGDNVAARDAVAVHRFPEPAEGVTSVAVTTAAYTYPTGPVDAEALLVGPDGLPVVLTKEDGEARVMASTAFADGVLVEAGTLPIPEPRTGLLTGFAGLAITAADAAVDTGPEGSRVLLRTYDSVVELTAPSPTAPLSELAGWAAAELPAAPEGQGEAVAYLPDGRSYVTASEGSGTIWLVPR